MTDTRKPAVSLIVPVYNETDRLISGMYHILSYFSNVPYLWEVIIVDDGSAIPVRTILEGAVSRKILRFPVAKLPVRIFRLPKNYGKGKAIAYGVGRARGKVVIFCDADLSVPISEIDALRTYLAAYPVVIGSRRTRKAKIVVRQSRLRESAGRIFTALSNILCNVQVADATCGFKGFDGEVAKRLFKLSRINRWVFDTEIIFLARKYGYHVFEMPVDWTNKAGSKVRLKDCAGSLLDLMRIRWNDMMGEYK